jgi:HAD superfamily hydrolase (TIGR01549 family)
MIVFIGAIAGAVFAGILGILLAAPTIASARVMIGYCYRKVLDLDPFELPVVAIRDPSLQWRGLISGRSVEGLLFDLDGTLLEMDEALVERLAERLRWAAFLFPARDPRPLIRWWMRSSEGIVNGVISLLVRFRLTGRFPHLMRLLREVRGYRDVDELKSVAGTVEMLRSLDGRYRLGLVTTRSRCETEAYLRRFGLEGVFQAIITRDDTVHLKPHPQQVHEAAAALGVPVQNCVLVGDTSVDVRAAQAAGALSIGVLCGFGREHDLSQADLILDSTAQLTEWV